MAKDSRKVSSEEAVRVEEATTLETIIRRRARGLIDAIVEEELEAALGAAESARVGPARQGYRHGTRERNAARSREDRRGRDRRMAKRVGASVSTPQRARG